jgi:hypothetical protein
MKAPQKTRQPNIQCAFLTRTPNGKEYICAALTELICAKKGGCKFFKPRRETYERLP